MKNLTKLGVASALISVSLLFCACGSEEDKIESAIKKEVQQKFNAQLLSFEEAKKEVGLKDKDCLKGTKNGSDFDYRFIKTATGDIEIVRLAFTYSVIQGKKSKDFLMNKAYFEDKSLTPDRLKTQKPECFN